MTVPLLDLFARRQHLLVRVPQPEATHHHALRALLSSVASDAHASVDSRQTRGPLMLAAPR